MSEKGKFTPGPWRISGAAEGAGITIEAKRNTLVAFVRDNQHPLTDVNEHEATANARLIAAAPQLYEALRKATRVIHLNLGQAYRLEDGGARCKYCGLLSPLNPDRSSVKLAHEEDCLTLAEIKLEQECEAALRAADGGE